MKDKITLPNIITFSRLVLLFPVFYFMVNGETVIATITLILLVLTDMLDGMAARKLNQCSDFGEYFDFVVDFVVYYSMFIYFMLTGMMGMLQTIFLGVGTVGLLIIAIGLSKKAKKMYMPHRLSSKIMAVILVSIIFAYVIDFAYANIMSLVGLGIVLVYTLPDYFIHLVKYKRN